MGNKENKNKKMKSENLNREKKEKKYLFYLTSVSIYGCLCSLFMCKHLLIKQTISTP